jgi:hypothetical protein
MRRRGRFSGSGSEASQPERKPLNRIAPQSLSRAVLDDQQSIGSDERPGL